MAINDEEDGFNVFEDSSSDEEPQQDPRTAEKAEEVEIPEAPPHGTEEEGDDSPNGHVEPKPAPAKKTDMKPARRRKPRERRSRRSLGVKPYVLALGVLSAVALLILLHSTSKIVFAGLLLLVVISWLLPHLPKKHELPSVAPHRGFRGKIYWPRLGKHLYAWKGWEWLANLSMAEREHNVDQDLREMDNVQTILVTESAKGGSGKTAESASTSIADASVTQARILGFDADVDGGHLAERYDIDPSKTLQLRTIIKVCKQGLEPAIKAMVGQVRWHLDTGVGLIASEEASNESVEIEDVFNAVLMVAKDYIRVYVDLNGSLLHNANLGCVLAGRVLTFPGLHRDKASVRDIRATITRYRDLGFRKVDVGICVIFGAKPRSRKEYADKLRWPVERVFCVPYNRYMASGDPISMPKFPRRIRVILKEIVRAKLRAELELRKLEADGVKLNPTLQELRKRLEELKTASESIPEQGEESRPRPHISSREARAVVAAHRTTTSAPADND